MSACLMVPLVLCHVWRSVHQPSRLWSLQEASGKIGLKVCMQIPRAVTLGKGTEESAHSFPLEDEYTQRDELLEICSMECLGMEV